MNLCLFLSCLMIFSNIGKGIDYMFKDVSQIKVSGGCEVFAEGSITFIPVDKDKTIVHVDNSGHYFYDENSKPIPSFEMKVQTEKLTQDIKNWMRLMNSVEKKPDYLSAQDATVLFDLSLQGGKVHFSHSENQEGYQLDPIIESIEAFVATCQKTVRPPTPKPSKPLFSAKNKTEEFLGSPDDREQVILQFNDMHGLYGGRVIVVNGSGNVMIQLVSHNSEQQKMWEKRYLFNISSEQPDEIFTEIINNDILTIQLEDRSGQPDEARIHFSITNGNNDFFKLETWEHASLPPGAYQNSPRAKFDKTCLLLKRLEHVAETEEKPVQEGPYVHP